MVHSKNFWVVYHVLQIHVINNTNRNKQKKINMLVSINVANTPNEIQNPLTLC